MVDRLNEISDLGESGYLARCPEVPGTNGQERTLAECRDSLKAASELIIEASAAANGTNHL